MDGIYTLADPMKSSFHQANTMNRSIPLPKRQGKERVEKCVQTLKQNQNGRYSKSQTPNIFRRPFHRP